MFWIKFDHHLRCFGHLLVVIWYRFRLCFGRQSWSRFARCQNYAHTLKCPSLGRHANTRNYKVGQRRSEAINSAPKAQQTNLPRNGHNCKIFRNETRSMFRPSATNHLVWRITERDPKNELCTFL